MNKRIENLKNISIEKETLDELFIKMVAFVPELNNETADELISSVVSSYGITKDIYLVEELYRVSEENLSKYFNDLKLRVRVDYLAETYGMTLGEAYEKLIELMNRGMISYYVVTNRIFDDLSSDNVLYHQATRHEYIKNLVKELSEIMGLSIRDTRQFIRDIRDKHKVGLFKIKREELFKRSDSEIEAYLLQEKIDNEKRAEFIKSETGWDDYELEREMLLVDIKYGIAKLDVYCDMEFWKIDDSIRDTYAVRKDAHYLNRTYNTVSTKVLDDKTLFDQEYKEFLRRKFWVNQDTSINEFKEFIDGLDEVFCKPINLLGGHGAYKYKLDKDVEDMYEYFINEPRLLVEEIPKQHHLINAIYDKSINTVRIMSALKDGVYYPFAAWMKFGAGGSIVDGRIDGGMYAGVDEKTGIIITKALGVNNIRYDKHPDTQADILGFQIPYWNEVLELTESALRHVEGINFVGWDLAICEDGPVIIEGNSKPAFVSYQMLFSDVKQGMKHKYEFLLD